MILSSASSEASPEKPRNRFYETDIENSCQYSRWFLWTLGLWPLISKNSSKWEKTISKMLIIFYLLAMMYPLIPTALHTILREKILLVKVMRLGPISACLSSILKYICMIIRCKTIKLCFQHMEIDWMNVEKENERAIMTRNAKVGRRLTVISLIFMYTGGVFYNIVMPILKGSRINALNETVRPVVYPGFDIFVDPQKSPAYEIIFCTCCVASFVRYTVTLAVCNLAAVFVTHACGQVQIVMARLENLFNDVDEKNSGGILQDRMSSAIHCHVRGLRLASRIDDVLREMCLIEVVAATLIICLLEYYCMTEWINSEIVAIITYFVFLLSYMFNIFIFCYIGELLKDQCSQVGNSSYLIDWYKLPGKTGLAIVMILVIANYPRKITAGRMIDLCLASFGMIIKTSLMYLNMLRAIDA